MRRREPTPRFEPPRTGWRTRFIMAALTAYSVVAATPSSARADSYFGRDCDVDLNTGQTLTRIYLNKKPDLQPEKKLEVFAGIDTDKGPIIGDSLSILPGEIISRPLVLSTTERSGSIIAFILTETDPGDTRAPEVHAHETLEPC